MTRASYYLKDNVIIYHGFYQLGLDEGEVNPGLNLEQIETLEVDVMEYLDRSTLDDLIEYYAGHTYPKLTLVKVMVATVEVMELGTSPDLLLVFKPDGIPSHEYVHAFGKALKRQLAFDASEGNNYQLPGLEVDVLIG